jgi:predicted ATPase
LILGASVRSLQGWAAPEVEKIYTRARQLCQQLGDPPELFRVLWVLTLYHGIRGDLRALLRMAEQLLALANESKQPPELVAAHQMWGQSTESGQHVV